MREVGILGFPEEVLFGLLAPAGTPRAIVMRLNSAVNEALRSAEVRASLDGIGVDVRAGTPETFAAALDEQAREWKRVIEETGIQVE
jgi:tripartite-type tricarboxylate transporter receptor subunit TctC